jgi:hypothetical protein
MAARRKISWQNTGFGAGDAFEPGEADRLAALAKVPDALRDDFKRRLGRMGGWWVAQHHVQAGRPTPVEVEKHLERVFNAALKLHGLLLGARDPREPGIRYMGFHQIPDAIQFYMTLAFNGLIRRGRMEAPPGFPLEGKARNADVSFSDPGGDVHLAGISDAVRRLLDGTEEALSIVRRKSKSHLQSRRGYTVEGDIVDNAFELYHMFGLPYRHEGGRGGCGPARFAGEVLAAMRRKVPTLQPLSHKAIQTRLSRFNKNPPAMNVLS